MARAAAALAKRRPILECAFLVAIALIATTGLTVAIIWASLHPKKLHHSIEQASISKLNLTEGGGRLNAGFDFVLRASNPNRHVSVYYDRIDAEVWYEGQKLSFSSVHPFHQPKRNVTFLDMALVAENAAVHGAAARDLRMERAAGEVNLDVKVRARIRLHVGVFKIHRRLKVDCESLTVPLHKHKGFQRLQCDTDI